MKRPITRRRLLAAGGGIALSSILAACGQAVTPTPAPAKPAEAPKPAEASKPTEAPKPAAEAPKPAAEPRPEGTPPPPAPAAPVAKPGQEIQVATRGGSDGETMEKTAARFLDKTGTKVTHVSYGGQPEYWAKVKAMHATKQAADVVWASTGGLYGFASSGILAELDPLIKGDKYELEDYVKAALDTCSLNGKLYAMPWGGHPGEGASVLYNIDLISKAGVSGLTEDCMSFDGWTWDKVAEAATKTTQGDTYGFMPATSFLSLTNTIGGFGGEFLSPDGKTLTIETPEFKKGLQLVADFFSKHKVAPIPDPKLDTGELFATGKLAMLQTGYWGQFAPGPKAIADRFKWGMGLVPKGPTGKRGSSLTINGQTVWSGSQKKEAAWSFVKFLLEPDQNVEIVLSGGSRPALRKSVLENPRLMNEMKSHKCFVPFLNAAEPWKQPANFRWEEFSQTVNQVFANLYLGKDTVDQAIANAKPKFQAILDKPVDK
ncbi:MAG TPA: sugar ABC transporter substrate-binding protein [Chloroflexota bacterium]|nr:sugar ABC transporter substrate-binding protein [Chloroflexota bacterium]